MPLNTAVWTIIALALLGANLPFLNQRLFAVLVLAKGRAPEYRKSIWIRLLELALTYVAIGALGFTLEANIGNVFPQGWEFYAVTGCLFLVLAFPGFVYQYLRRA